MKFSHDDKKIYNIPRIDTYLALILGFASSATALWYALEKNNIYTSNSSKIVFVQVFSIICILYACLSMLVFPDSWDFTYVNFEEGSIKFNDWDNGNDPMPLYTEGMSHWGKLGIAVGIVLAPFALNEFSKYIKNKYNSYKSTSQE